MSLTRLAVNRPITTLMASLIVVILGWVALTRLSVDLMPDLTYPTVSVQTLYRGAGPDEVENLITRPLEQALSSVNGVEQIASNSSEGSSSIRVRMQWGTNLDAAVSSMRQSIQKIRQSRALPDEVEEPFIRYYDVADNAIMYLGLSSELDAMQLSRLAEFQVVPALEKISGVARVRLRGDVRREIQVNLDRSALEALNMGVNEVVTALGQSNVNQPAGVYDEGNIRRIIRSQGEFHSIADIGNTVVRRTTDAIVRIRDIAEVVDGEEERTEMTRMNGLPGLLVYIYKQAGANTIDVSDRVHRAVADLNRRMNSANLVVRIDKSEFIRQSIENVKMSAMYGMGLAVVVLILFLRSFRSTLVIGVSMPLSVLATFVLIYFKGFTLNIVSFGGLALGIGLLVDNSIVVLESIFRKRDDGLEMKAAAIEGTREVAGAIVASTFTTLIVFVPLLFITGMTGVLLHQLAWVVSFSLLCSLLASLTLTPVLTAYWLGPKTIQIEDRETNSTKNTKSPRLPLSPSLLLAFPSSLTRKVLSLFPFLVRCLHAVSRFVFQMFENAYSRLIRFCLRWPGLTATVLFACLMATLGLIPRIGTEFVPKADEGYLRVDSEMTSGIQLATLDQQTRQLERVIIDNVPEAMSTAVFVGDDIDDADSWNTSRFRIKLLPRTKRKRSIEQIRKNLAAQIRPIPGMKVRVQASNDMMIFRMLSYSGSGGDVEVEVRGHDMRTGEELAEVVAERMKQIPGLVNIEVEKEDRRPELTAYIDRQKASVLGVSVRDITQTLETTIRGTHATVYREEGEESKVLVRLRENDRNRQRDIELVGVSTPSGRVIPLKNVVRFAQSETPVSIHRLDQQRVINVSADVEERDLGSVVADLQYSLDAVRLPNDFTINIAGDWEEQQKSFQALRQGLILAIVMMYMVMASQFESLRDPLLILVTIPLGAIGVILMLVSTKTTLNVQSYIGLVMLAGIVVNNAIVLIDYINQLRRLEPETNLDEIIIRAAVRRFRPILMTTLTTVLAMLPIALGWGEGGELQAPMARVVIGGLTSGTLITLLAIPLVYQAFGSRHQNVAV